MKYYTKEWYHLMQSIGHTDGIIVLPDKTYTDDEIRAFYDQDLRAEIEHDRRLHCSSEPFDPTETINCFRECYEGMLKYGCLSFPKWFNDTADKRLFALNRMTESVYTRLKAEETENRRRWDDINQKARSELSAQNIPSELACLDLHDACILQLTHSGSTAEMLLCTCGFADNGTPYLRICFDDVTRFELESGEDIAIYRGGDGYYSSNLIYLYDELYRTEHGYEYHILLTDTDLRTLTVSCGDIRVVTDIDFEP